MCVSPGISVVTEVGQLCSRGSKVCKVTMTDAPRIMGVCFSAALLQGMFMRAAVLVMGLNCPTTLSDCMCEQ